MPQYVLPIPKSLTLEILKPKGKFAHENFIESRYAIDFKVPIGTPVMAAKEGEILIIKADSKKYGIDAKAEDANFVCIDHGDGTFAEYIHLGYQKIFVKVKQHVKQGDVLGLTGYSGVMDVPHLHFNLFKIVDKKAVSIPVDFK